MVVDQSAVVGVSVVSPWPSTVLMVVMVVSPCALIPLPLSSSSGEVTDSVDVTLSCKGGKDEIASPLFDVVRDVVGDLFQSIPNIPLASLATTCT